MRNVPALFTKVSNLPHLSLTTENNAFTLSSRLHALIIIDVQLYRHNLTLLIMVWSMFENFSCRFGLVERARCENQGVSL